MLAIYCLRQTSRRLIIHTSRSTLSTLSNSKSEEAESGTDTTSTNYPSFYNTTKPDELLSQGLKTSTVESSKIDTKESSVPINDLLEAQRIGKEQKTNQTSPPVTTSTEKFSAGIAPLQPSSSITPTGVGLFHDAKISSTPISPGIPITGNASPTIKEEDSRKDDRIPSSRFSAFLRGIRSGLPFFPSPKTSSVPINIATTREYYIPLTRPSLIRLIATDPQLLDDIDDRYLFHELCQGFDSAVVQRYSPVLNELKYLFSPLNPDNETLSARRISYRDRLDNEYWLLQKLNDLLHQANFKELPREILLDKFLIHQDSLSNINIHINGYDYDVFKIWILGREQMPTEKKSWWKNIFARNKLVLSNDYFKRVILAIRIKGHDRLYLKAYRDIPLQNLTQLLPTGKLQMGNFDRQAMKLSVLLGFGTFFTHLITTMANYPIPGLLVGGSSLSIGLGLWTLTNIYQAKINYLSSMSRLLFHKNIASNKQLFAMIIDRAEDELSKEVLLVYMFILWKQKQKADLTNKNLELEIENWIRLKTNTDITFKSDQSIEFLRKIGIILADDPNRPDRLHVIPLQQTVGILPKTSRALSEKNEEWDLIEGYDKKYFELDWKTVLNEDKLLNKSGWN